MISFKFGAALALGLMWLGAPAQAQLFNRPPAVVPGDGAFQQAQGVDSAGLLVRIDRLENQVRNLNGQIEQMQFQMRRMEDQFRKFQQDVDFRFQELSGKPAPRPAATPPQQRRGDVIEAPAANPSAPPLRTARRGDAFDPELEPAAPGAPRRLGTLDVPGQGQSAGINVLPGGALPPAGDILIDEEVPLESDGPLDLSPRAPRGSVAMQPPAQPSRQVAAAPPSSVDPGFPTLPRLLPSSPQQRPQATPQGPIANDPPAVVAALPPPTGPAGDYEAALASYRAGQYEAAGSGFEDFLRKYPKDRRVSEAVFYLGESFARRGRHREAAEQFLKVSTDYSKASRAAEAMVKLALSLDKLGLKEQACATYAEAPRKYPNLSASLRTTVEREQKRGQC